MTKKSRQAALYLRISHDRSGDELGIQRQREDCERLAATKGWDVVATFADDDLSAFSGKPRPAYNKLLAALEDGSVDSVIAWHPDRLHRSPKELEAFIDLIERTHAQVATVMAGDLDLSTASGRMTARIVGSVARHESEQKSERLRCTAVRTAAREATATTSRGSPSSKWKPPWSARLPAAFSRVRVRSPSCGTSTQGDRELPRAASGADRS